MKHKFNMIQSQMQFIATILCGDSDLVCMTIHSISSESNLINALETTPNLFQNQKMAGMFRRGESKLDEDKGKEAR